MPVSDIGALIKLFADVMLELRGLRADVDALKREPLKLDADTDKRLQAIEGKINALGTQVVRSRPMPTPADKLPGMAIPLRVPR